ncbi:MAG: TonB-dependent receptor [Bacteroidales bacterium]|nr:TonB-dependent receptor [Bacteroidales bacterium]
MGLRLTFLFISCFVHLFFIQAQYNISGRVFDAQSKEPLIGATVINKLNGRGTITNTQGYYVMQVDSGQVDLQITYIGYESAQIKRSIDADTIINISLVAGLELDEWLIKAHSGISDGKMEVGQMNLAVHKIPETPVIGGESNVITSLKSLPGVGFGREGSSELFVRGGSHDQNLILLDEAPVYNLNHAFGLVSVFNTPTIKNVTLYKGGIPADYGGHLSSVLDITTKEGDKQTYHGDFALSTFAASLSAYGPIVKDKVSFNIAVRRSWPDLLLSQLMSNEQQYQPGLYFLDINTKINYVLKDKHHFCFSYYTGQDKLFLKSHSRQNKLNSEQGWGNHLTSLRWNYASPNGMFNKVTMYYSRFFEFDNMEQSIEGNKLGYINQSQMDEIGLKGSIAKQVNDNLHVKVGTDCFVRRFQTPYKLNFQGEKEYIVEKKSKTHQTGVFIYSSANWNHNNFMLKAGVRGGTTIIASEKRYTFEPRLSAQYQLNKQWMLMAGATSLSQSMVAITKSNNGFPGFIWLPVNKNQKLQRSTQLSTGLHYHPQTLSVGVEAYYKIMNNVISHPNYSSALYEYNDWSNIVQQGKGQSYGLELLAEYTGVNWDIQLAYTLSKTEYVFGTVNNGAWFPADFDIRHDINWAGTYLLRNDDKGKNRMTINYAINSGSPLTMPTQSIRIQMPIFDYEQYWFNFGSLDYYERTNNARQNWYHRLDIGYHMEKNKNRGSRIWNIGLINCYNQQNPYAYFRGNDGVFKQIVLFPLMPYVSFRRKF